VAVEPGKLKPEGGKPVAGTVDALTNALPVLEADPSGPTVARYTSKKSACTEFALFQWSGRSDNYLEAKPVSSAMSTLLFPAPAVQVFDAQSRSPHKGAIWLNIPLFSVDHPS
jgi:hypothetical protein